MFQTAFSIAQKQSGKSFPTGISVLNKLLGGGFESGLSYLLYGSPHCTQLLQQSIASALQHVASPEDVAVIDANNGIRPDTILTFLRPMPTPLTPTSYLARLHIARAFTTEQLLSLLNDTSQTIQEQNAPILFVNGIMHLVQEEEEGDSSSNTQAGLPPDPRIYRRGQLATYLKQLAFTQQIAVVVSADAPKRRSQPPLHIGQLARHRFHVLIHHSRHNNLDTFTLEKHPNRPTLQLHSTIPRFRWRLGSRQMLLSDNREIN
ncbi:MAG: hypothetical protein ACFFD8_05715 [Candidatus Thorarchaeota archaeon]